MASILLGSRRRSGGGATRDGASDREADADRRRRAGETAAAAGDLALLVGVYALAVILFFPASRYRLPVLPLLLVFGGVGVASWIDAVRRGRWDELRLPGLVLLVMLPLSNLGAPAMASTFTSDTYSDMGTLYFDQGKWDEAIRWYRRALDIDAGNAEAAHNTGAALLRLNRPAEAEPCFRRVLAAWPGDPKALINLGNVYFMQGDPYRAGRYYLEVYQADPTYPDAEGNFELCRQAAAKLEAQRMVQDPEKFLAALERMYQAEPGNGFLRERLRALLSAVGDQARAARLFGQ
jgi:tetratricopeptide (TPR) repeat protein